MSSYPIRPLVGLTALVVIGTVYSVVQGSYLDTSNPLLTNLPHPLHKTHYFASKLNVVNVFFIKKLWIWTTAAVWALFLTSPPKTRRIDMIYKWCAGTLVWLMFTTWFFGPALLDRMTISTGGECVVHLPSGALVSVPEQLCYSKSRVTLQTHPELFASSLVLPEETWGQVPRIRRGHDVSGHLFLLTMTILLLGEHLQVTLGHFSRTMYQAPWSRWFGIGMAFFVLSLSYFSAWTTSLYFHTPLEKFSGFCKWRCLGILSLSEYIFSVLGIAGYSVTRLATFDTPTQPRVRS
jgi:hypothetical protein